MFASLSRNEAGAADDLGDVKVRLKKCVKPDNTGEVWAVSTGTVEAVRLIDLAQPSMPAPTTLAGAYVPPKQRIYFYSSDVWEEFILEWVTGLKKDDNGNAYVQIKQLGGSGDAGIDVAAFKSAKHLEGPWDCFQGKHYVSALVFSDASKEILKVLRHVGAGDYVLPDRYLFIAPQGAATSLNRLLSTPSKLRSKFLGELELGKALVKGLTEEEIQALREQAASLDFSMFQAVQPHEVLDVHSRTPYHAARFGTPIPQRTTPARPPEVIAEIEAQYVSELRRVYLEKDPRGIDETTILSDHPDYGDHFQRQRVSFYKAESLRMDARDAVPDGTFEALQGDVFDGVIDVVESNHPSALDRLTAVLVQATALNLGQHALVAITRPDDVKGICHQLSNDSRLSWAKEGT
ncbi:ABC-three component system protein [Nocardia carnea]|uniref:ABC-three component system protein n=1 Tax=Nocardia carnea TaxID=37328 RepID=UPI00245411E3|nr:ABC-three component system protein [Nocardia carnea]